MLTLSKMTKKLASENGFSLIEILVSCMILLAVFTATYQIMPYPKQRVVELEEKAELVHYLDQKLTAYKSGSSLASGTTYCNESCVSGCDTSFCDDFNTECGATSGAVIDPILTNMVNRHKSMCFVKVEVDPTCDPNLINTADAKQVCAIAKWPKNKVGMEHKYDYEALTTFVFKP